MTRLFDAKIPIRNRELFDVVQNYTSPEELSQYGFRKEYGDNSDFLFLLKKNIQLAVANIEDSPAVMGYGSEENIRAAVSELSQLLKIEFKER